MNKRRQGRLSGGLTRLQQAEREQHLGDEVVAAVEAEEHLRRLRRDHGQRTAPPQDAP
jgi:hypothetical protein